MVILVNPHEAAAHQLGITEHSPLLDIGLKPRGTFYIEDYFQRQLLTEADQSAWLDALSCPKLPTLDEYRGDLENAGFVDLEFRGWHDGETLSTMFTTTTPGFNQNRANILPHDLFEAIHSLKQELNAVILAHYYQEPDIQDIADFLRQ